MKKTHYYPDSPEDGWETACGRDGRETGGFIAFFFKTVEQDERCKVCNKRFEKDQRETPNQTPEI